LGMMLPGGAAIPAVYAERLRHGESAGKRAVGLAVEGLKPSKIMTSAAFKNALRVLLAVGGSTNGIIHITAVAGRLGIEVDLASFDEMGKETPVLIDLKPSGQYYMDDLYRAGGLGAILRELKPLLNLDCLTITGRTLGEEIDASPEAFSQNVVFPIDNPIFQGGGIAYLTGNLAGDGAILKQSAATQDLLVHSGRAVVFDSLEDLALRIDDPELDVVKGDVLILRNAGPKGAPGMPEAGYIPIPKKLAEQGVKDMVRISDCRMSGTAFGTIILHASPEAAVGGPLSLVRTGDIVHLNAPERTLTMEVDAAELEKRREAWVPPGTTTANRGYRKLFLESVMQANEGVDFEFLTQRPYIEKVP